MGQDDVVSPQPVIAYLGLRIAVVHIECLAPDTLFIVGDRAVRLLDVHDHPLVGVVTVDGLQDLGTEAMPPQIFLYGEIDNVYDVRPLQNTDKSAKAVLTIGGQHLGVAGSVIQKRSQGAALVGGKGTFI